MAQIGQRLIVQIARDAAAFRLGLVGQAQAGLSQFQVRLFERAIGRRQAGLLAEGQRGGGYGGREERRQEHDLPGGRRATDSQVYVERSGIDQVSADGASDYSVRT